MTREDAIELLNQFIKNERILNHCYASEAVMKALARRLGRDEEEWGIAGLLHDLDLDMIGEDLSQHGHKTVEMLKSEWYDIPERGLYPCPIKAGDSQKLTDSHQWAFWFYDVLFCNKCNRSLAYYTYEITDDGEDIKKFIIKKPFKNKIYFKISRVYTYL